MNETRCQSLTQIVTDNLVNGVIAKWESEGWELWSVHESRGVETNERLTRVYFKRPSSGRVLV